MVEDPASLIERSSEARRSGDHSAAVALAEEAISSARARPDPRLASAIAQLARLRRDEHRREDAVKLYEEAASVAREQGDERLLAQLLRHIGDVATEQGELDRAEECLLEAEKLFDGQELSELNKANFIRSKALLRERQGDHAAAASLWTDARARYATCGIDAGVAESDRRLQRLGSA